MKVLVTGASGFVGSSLCAHLIGKGHAVRGAVRSTSDKPLPGVDVQVVSDYLTITSSESSTTFSGKGDSD